MEEEKVEPLRFTTGEACRESNCISLPAAERTGPGPSTGILSSPLSDLERTGDGGDLREPGDRAAAMGDGDFASTFLSFGEAGPWVVDADADAGGGVPLLDEEERKRESDGAREAMWIGVNLRAGTEGDGVRADGGCCEDACAWGGGGCEEEEEERAAEMVGAFRISIRVLFELASGLEGRARFGVALRVSLAEEGPEPEVGLMRAAMLFCRPCCGRSEAGTGVGAWTAGWEDREDEEAKSMRDETATAASS